MGFRKKRDAKKVYFSCVAQIIVDTHKSLKEAVLRVTLNKSQKNMSRDVRKPVFGVSDQVRDKLGCAATKDSWRLEISDLGRRGIVLSKALVADLRLCFRICKKPVFS